MGRSSEIVDSPKRKTMYAPPRAGWQLSLVQKSSTYAEQQYILSLQLITTSPPSSKLMNLVRLLLSLLLLVSAHAGAQDAKLSQNYRFCEAGYSSCDVSLLNASQFEQVRQSALTRNFRYCDSGYSSCDLGLLTERQRAQVHGSALARNLRNCDSGYSSCDQSLLTPSQQVQVSESHLKRNFRNCDSGYSSCDPTLLTQQQQGKVAVSALDRNFTNCDKGYSACDTALLTAAQRKQAEVSGLTRNFRNCNSGYSTCDTSLLTDIQRTTVEQSAYRRNSYNCQKGYSSCIYTARASATLPPASGRTANASHARAESNSTGGKQPAYERPYSASIKPHAPTTALVSGAAESAPLPAPSGPSCAENGSCYGDISSATMRPKTTHVSGYTRRDGTYVRGHYRSK